MHKTKNLILIISIVAGLIGLEAWSNSHTSDIDTSQPNQASQTLQETSINSDTKPAQPDPAGNQENPSDAGSLVRFSSPSAAQAFLSLNQLDQSALIPSTGSTYLVNRTLTKLQFPAGSEGFPNRRYQALLIPNDASYSSQWHLPKIAAPSAWDTNTGAASATKIAVIDTGFALTHQDLSASWATNAGEVGAGKETNGIDDDGNGKIDDWRGWDFVCNNNSPQAGDTDCDSAPGNAAASHGTLTSGAAGAATNNGVGVASLDWNVKVLPLQALGDDGSGSTADVAAAIDYAVSQGAKVISLSLGSTSVDNYLRQRIDAAISAGVLVIAAAGNCGDANSWFLQGCDYQGQMLDPANYGPVLAVGATDSNDNRASFSSYGNTLDVMAPGSNIYSTNWTSGNQTSSYGSASGTSLATPIVSGLAALLADQNPTANVNDLKQFLINGTDKVTGMGGQNYTNYYGYGRINAAKSLQYFAFTTTAQAAFKTNAKTTTTSLSQLSAGQTAWLTVQVTNTGTATWQKTGPNPMRLGTEGPKDRTSRYYGAGWLSQNRAASLTEDSVAPGATGTFEFPITVPAGGGSYTERFNLVAEGLQWLPDAGISFSTTVTNGYSWAFAGQQAYTDNTKSNAINTGNLSPGQVVYFVVQAQNTGSSTWYKSGNYPARLATAKPFDRASQFYDSRWISANRPAALSEDSVAPGGIGTFEAYYQIPNGSGLTPEYLNPVIDGLTHLNQVGLYLPADIKSNYSWAFAGQQAYTDNTKTTPINLNTLSAGQIYYFRVQATNTGNATWFNSGKYPLRLGTSRPLDRTGSLFYHATWLSTNRPNSLLESSLAPGQTGTFEGYFKAPANVGNYKEYLQPVAEGITWLNDLGLYIPANVTP